MIIAYLSITGNVQRFVESFADYETMELDPNNPFVDMNQPYIVIVPAYDKGIEDDVSDLIDHKDNLINLCGFVGSGNKNFENGFAFNAKNLAKKYNKPLLHTFELSGSESDAETVKGEIDKIAITRAE